MSDAWSMSRLTYWLSKPGYYMVDFWILAFPNASKTPLKSKVTT